MSDMTWAGVMPAITTPFDEELKVDFDFLADHARWLVDSGATGIVPLGSLGEGSTLELDEKIRKKPRRLGVSGRGWNLSLLL